MIQLIISADDFAQSPAIDAGIISLIQLQKISATSCLVLSPRWKEAAKAITPDVRANASIGLHLDFTLFGGRFKLSTLIIRTMLRTLPYTYLEQAIHAQLNAFEETLGTPPDYIDGHQHVHQLPQIRDALIHVLKQRYPHHTPWLRIAKPPFNAGFKAWIIRLLGADALTKLALANGFKCNNALFGVYDFGLQGTPYKTRLMQWLAEIQLTKSPSNQTAALMCHPAISDGKAHLEDSIYAARLIEYEALKSIQLQDMQLLKQPI